jgi:hypothetical protein
MGESLGADLVSGRVVFAPADRSIGANDRPPGRESATSKGDRPELSIAFGSAPERKSAATTK